jgi:hypothetical protein
MLPKQKVPLLPVGQTDKRRTTVNRVPHSDNGSAHAEATGKLVEPPLFPPWAAGVSRQRLRQYKRLNEVTASVTVTRPCHRHGALPRAVRTPSDGQSRWGT